MQEKFQELCEEHGDCFLTYEDGMWEVYIGLNMNHGIYDEIFGGSDLDKVLTEALAWEEE